MGSGARPLVSLPTQRPHRRLRQADHNPFARQSPIGQVQWAGLGRPSERDQRARPPGRRGSAISSDVSTGAHDRSAVWIRKLLLTATGLHVLDAPVPGWSRSRSDDISLVGDPGDAAALIDRAIAVGTGDDVPEIQPSAGPWPG